MIDNFASSIVRSTLLTFSTTISIMVVMMMVGIISVDDAIAILKLEGDSANALRAIVSRMQEVFDSILDILSQLLNQLFNWAGVDIDLSKIKIDLDKIPKYSPDGVKK